MNTEKAIDSKLKDINVLIQPPSPDPGPEILIAGVEADNVV
jgi:hypothetical protein